MAVISPEALQSILNKSEQIRLLTRQRGSYFVLKLGPPPNVELILLKALKLQHHPEAEGFFVLRWMMEIGKLFNLHERGH